MYVRLMPAVLHELHQCITEVVIQGLRYDAVNLTTSTLLMEHLKGNQGSTHQTPVGEMKYFLTLFQWFHVIMAFCILVTWFQVRMTSSYFVLLLFKHYCLVWALASITIFLHS
jgi:hypothetical protein